MNLLRAFLIVLAIAPAALAQTIAQPFDLPASATSDEAALARAMPVLAKQAIAAYQEPDRDRYLNNLFRMQIVAGDYGKAVETIRSLRGLRRLSDPSQGAAAYVQYEIYAAAKAKESATASFSDAFAQAFRAIYEPLDNRTALQVVFSFGGDLEQMHGDLMRVLESVKGKEQVELATAVDLIRRFQIHEAYRQFMPLSPALVAADDKLRYVIEEATVKAADGATLAALVIRPRSTPARLPALLNFTIYAKAEWSYDTAKKSAAYGYAGVVGYTRGKGRSPEAAVPFEHDGSDAAAVIQWISSQPWNDGRVGMYGGSYEGFAQWAAAKHLPPALKAIMPSVPVAPGIDYPMEGNVFQTYPYKWLPYVLNNKGLDDKTYEDDARWDAMSRAWYTKGLAYRSLEKIDGTPNPVFLRWLAHPSYDSYWQQMIPFGDEFAKIDIPVLTTTGYYDGCLVSALYYFTEHNQHHPGANHYLVVGPWDHVGAQHRAANVLQGYEIDPVARVDIEELRYQWFDHVFKGAAKPALLRDRVNYEVMGANEWRHAGSLAEMSNASLRFHLSGKKAGLFRVAARRAETTVQSFDQTVDFADRKDADQKVSTDIVTKSIDMSNAVAFLSDPMQQAVTISGLFSAQLDFVANKQDLDLSIQLYELTPGGDYVQLSSYLGRASYARNRSSRRLLTPDKREKLTIRSHRLTARKLAPQSRVVIVVRVVKDPQEQINYGTGRDVSDETIADAKTPLKLRWYTDSYVDVPITTEAMRAR